MSKFQYSCVAKQSFVLCEACAPGTKAWSLESSTINEVLQKARAGQARQSSPHGLHMQHFISDGTLVYMALTEAAVSKEVAFGFLSKLQEEFFRIYGSKVGTLGPRALDKSYGKKLKEMMKSADSNPGEFSKIEKVKQATQEAKQAIQGAILKGVQRGEKLEVLEMTTKDLENDANLFKQKAVEVKHKEQWKNLKCMALVFGLLVVVAVVLFFSICGGLRCVSS